MSHSKFGSKVGKTRHMTTIEYIGGNSNAFEVLYG
ncbi:hypothetical protein LSS_22945 [Leptospira santarosai serovar Shermani str. LT 821]|uniref:Uncharacterized protein n=1 Tax=Leptospira santarosai serovar Shermani str. LT 821 TaxID=758847 RepID=A0A097ET15_9LEPT|nr:hypothetical protein LSS_22945 [Leptospira santarosai serovar Shermani str. LT 821]